MSFKLETSHLPGDTLEKVKKLDPAKHQAWYEKYDNYCLNRKLYEELIRSIKEGSVPPNELNKTISNKKQLEDTLYREEMELLNAINMKEDNTSRTKLIHKFQLLSVQGTVNIRPPKSAYSKPIGRSQAQ